MSKRSSKDDKKKIVLGLLGLAGLYFLTRSSNQNDNLSIAPAQTPVQTPVRQQAAQAASQTAATGNNRAYIVRVQQFLNSKGYKIPVTGVWNKATNNAQVLYMQRNKIKTSATFRKLVESWKAPIR